MIGRKLAIHIAIWEEIMLKLSISFFCRKCHPLLKTGYLMWSLQLLIGFKRKRCYRCQRRNRLQMLKDVKSGSWQAVLLMQWKAATQVRATGKLLTTIIETFRIQTTTKLMLTCREPSLVRNSIKMKRLLSNWGVSPLLIQSETLRLAIVRDLIS